MVKRDLNKERESELAAIWGSDVVGDKRFPKRKGGARKSSALSNSMPDDAEVDEHDLLSDQSDAERDNDGSGDPRKKKTAKDAKKEKSKKARLQYKLHCFVEPGTTVNDVREVFEQYEPSVQLKVAQKGNQLNKTSYAILAFKNKAMALHAVKKLDGTNQRDLLGVTSLKLQMMLTRQQNKIARRQARKSKLRELAAKRMSEMEDDETFIQNFVKEHESKKKK